MKTPIQELIEKYQEMRENGDTDMRTVIHFAKEMLEKEKDVIENAYWDGGQEVPTVVSRCEDYYNKTFNNNDQ